jgi:hypothetical protein
MRGSTIVYEGHFYSFAGLSAINPNPMKKLRASEWYVLDNNPVNDGNSGTVA